MPPTKEYLFEKSRRKERGEIVVAVAAENLRNQRLLLKLTKKEAAKLCDVSYNTYRGLENGNPRASLKIWADVFIALGGSMDRVFYSDEKPEYFPITTIIHKLKARRNFSSLVLNKYRSRANKGS